MIKFSKWMYELGYKAAIKAVLSAVDNIPNERPREEDFKAMVRDEQHLKRKMDSAIIVYSERKALKNHIHRLFDPNYEAEVTDMAKKMLGDDDDLL